MKLIFAILAFLSVYFLGCGTRTPTYYDIDKTQVTDASNIIYDSGNFKCIGTFSHYANSTNRNYSGIFLNLIFSKDSIVRIENIDVNIRPFSNGRLNYPISFATIDIIKMDQIEGSNFAEIREVANEQEAPSVIMIFQDNAKLYDSLFMNLTVTFKVNEQEFIINRRKTYVKGFYFHPISR